MAEEIWEWKQWKIYHRDREYAQPMGDPLVAVVSAATKQEAERESSKRFPLPSGAGAVEERRKAHEPSLEMEF